MAQVSKPYTFSNQTTADATQVDADFDALYTLVNGQLDNTNVKSYTLSTAIANEGVTPGQTLGVPYSSDLYGGPFLFSGFTVTKDGTTATQIDVAAGIAFLKQGDGSLRRLSIPISTQRTSVANATYYLDLNPDGSWWWSNTGHSTQSNYISVATVTTDAGGNVNVVTQTTNSYKVTVLSGATGPVEIHGLSTVQYIPLWLASNTNANTGNSNATTAGSLFVQKGASTPANSTTGSATNLHTLDSWPSSVQFALEASLQAASGYTAYVALWDITAGAIVSSSQISTTATTYTVVRSSKFSLTAGHAYGVTWWVSAASNMQLTDISLVVFPS